MSNFVLPALSTDKQQERDKHKRLDTSIFRLIVQFLHVLCDDAEKEANIEINTIYWIWWKHQLVAFILHNKKLNPNILNVNNGIWHSHTYTKLVSSIKLYEMNNRDNRGNNNNLKTNAQNGDKNILCFCLFAKTIVLIERAYMWKGLNVRDFTNSF